MKRNLFLASLALVAMASCQKQSVVDHALTTNQAIRFTPYAGASATKGTPINTNTEFAGTDNSFRVGGNFQATNAASASGKYFDFSKVTYGGSTEVGWTNTDKMYWPNEAGTIYFGAYYPADAAVIDTALTYASKIGFTFGYTVAADVYAAANTTSTKGTVTEQKDIMYAVTSKELAADKTAGKEVLGSEADVNLHFKHALTQVAFTATKEDDIEVSVSGITLCNVMDGGIFTATANTDDPDSPGTTPDADVTRTNFGAWTAQADSKIAHYVADMNSDDAIVVDAAKGATAVVLTSPEDALMLIPQTLTAWDKDATSSTGTQSYLAINCTITHKGTDIAADIVNGIIYVPFSTNGIDYKTTGVTNNVWNPGYKITYNLHFGGGFTDPDKPTTPPEPGKTPEEDIVETLRAITYTITVDDWINGPSVDVETAPTTPQN